MAGDPGRETAPTKTNAADNDSATTWYGAPAAQHHGGEFSSAGQVPPVASGAAATKPSASDQAFGAHDAKKKVSKGVSKSGGGTVRDALVRLVNAGKLDLSAHKIAQLDALAQVETGGKIGSVDTTDDMGVSIGFHQVVLGHKSVEWVIQQAPEGFAKHGIVLDMSKTYNVQGWSHPHQIKGIEDPADLRSGDWAERFYAASLDDDVIVAVVKWALKEAKEVDAKTEKAGASQKQSFWEDDTAKTWILECDNNRPGYTGPAVKRAVSLGANEATDREAFLDILAKAIVETYEDLEPKMVGYKKLKAKYPHEDDAKLHAMAVEKWKSIGHTKGTHIVEKISRHLKIPKLDVAAHGGDEHETPVAQVAQQAPTAPVPQAPAPVTEAPKTEAPKADASAAATTAAVGAATGAATTADTKPLETKPVETAPEPKAPTTVAASGHLRVTATHLNVRSTPSSHEHDNIVGTLRHGEQIEAIGKTGEWVSISHKGQSAFVHGSYVEEVKAPAEDHVAESKAEPETQPRDTAPAPQEKPAAQKPAHHEHHEQKAAHVQAPAPQQAPASTVASVQNHAADQVLRGEYAMLLTLVEAGIVSQGLATEQLIKFDRDLHGGQISPTGLELVAGFPFAVAQHEAKKHAEKEAQKKPAPSEQQVAATAPVAAHQEAAPKHEANASATANAPLPKIALAENNRKLVDELRGLGTPSGTHTAELLERVDTHVALLSKKLNLHEYDQTKDTDRNQLVEAIGALRKAVGVLEAPDALKSRIYIHIQDIAPYHSQSRNVDILESETDTRTCNLTSTSMALESVGATPESYDAARMPIVQRVYDYYEKNQQKGKKLDKADLQVSKANTTLTGLRMPDFLELAAIAEGCTATSTDEEIKKVGQDTYKKILSISFLEDIAKRFKVKTHMDVLKVGGKSVGNDLFNWGKTKTGKDPIHDNYRMETERLVDARNKVESLESQKDDPKHKDEYVKAKATYDDLSGKRKHIMDGEGAPMELAQYRQAVMEQVGVPFSNGKAVVIALSGHFTKLQGITEDHLVIGDPGRWDTGSHRKVLWEEARGMGYFHHYLLIG